MENAKVLPLRRPEKRLNVNLPERKYNRLQDLAKDHGISVTTLVRSALGLMEIVLEEIDTGNKILVAKSDGRIEKEIALPL